jgi:predicted secreted hydrolase
MGKLSKISILLITLLFAILLFALVAFISVFQSTSLENALSNIEALTFAREPNNGSAENKGVMSKQTFGRGFSASNPQNLGNTADPNYVISFPEDHGAHESFDIEWWYLTANLQDEAGNVYGLQWTLFRFRNPNNEAREHGQTNVSTGSRTFDSDDTIKTPSSDWNNQHIYMAHASVHSASQHWFSEKFARGNVGNAGVETAPFKLFIDDWQWQSPTPGLLPATLAFNARLISDSTNSSGISYLDVQLNLSNTGPYILQGQNGYSIKSANGKHASHYYSAPFIQVEGKFTVSDELLLSRVSEQYTPVKKRIENENKTDESLKHIAVKGNAWFDQEWTSQLFDQATLGWDWLSLHLDNGDKIMAFRMRLQDQPDYITGTYIQADGSSATLMPSDLSLDIIKFTELGNKKLPLQWALSIPSKGINIKVETSKNDQWNPAFVAYYEGSVVVSGTHTGRGFLELTGY